MFRRRRRVYDWPGERRLGQARGADNGDGGYRTSRRIVLSSRHRIVDHVVRVLRSILLHLPDHVDNIEVNNKRAVCEFDPTTMS